MRTIFLALLLILHTGFVWAEPTTERLLEIKELVRSLESRTLYRNISFRPNNGHPGPASASRTGEDTFLIEYNPPFFRTLSGAGQAFILFHELGHIHLGHVNTPYPGADGARQFELEADAFATFLYKRLGLGLTEEFFDFVKVIERRPATIPSGAERAALIRKAAEL
jgi:hypothetical protein